MRRMILLLWITVAGCSSDPALDPLQPGSQAVAVLDPNRPKIPGFSSSEHVALWKDEDDDRLTRYVGLSPGVRVTIGDDPGYYERTQPEIDKELKEAAERKASEYEIKSLKDEKPARYPPPHWRAGHRNVRVVVESGEHRGVAGTMARKDLRPIKGE